MVIRSCASCKNRDKTLPCICCECDPETRNLYVYDEDTKPRTFAVLENKDTERIMKSE